MSEADYWYIFGPPWREYGNPVDLDHRVGRRGYRQAADARQGPRRVLDHDGARRGGRVAGRIPRSGPWLVCQSRRGSWDHRLNHRRDAPATDLSDVRGAEG